MSAPIIVQILGAPIACKNGVKDSWRVFAGYVIGQLQHRFGETVQVTYHDLFDTDRPQMPTNAQLPLVLVNGEMVINGGKISMPIIRGKIEEILAKETA